MRRFSEYANGIIENGNFDLAYSKIQKYYVDKNNGTIVKNNGYDELQIYYQSGKGISVSLNKRIYTPLILIINLMVKNNNRSETASISFKSGDLKVSVFDKDIYNSDRHLINCINIADWEVVVNDYKNGNEKHICANEVSVEVILSEINNAIINAHDSKEWKNEIESLLELIKPALLMCVLDGKDRWIETINGNLDRVQEEINYIDSKMSELVNQRAYFVYEYIKFNEAKGVLEQYNHDEIENSRKK